MNNDLTPRHLQLREILFRRWKTNGVKVGDRIESQNEIIKFCDFSLITVIKTLKDLEAEGIIHRLVGKGSFLVHAPWAEAYYRVGFFYNRDVVGGGIFNNSFYTNLVVAFEKMVANDGHAFIMGSFTHKKFPLAVWEALDMIVLTSITSETDLEFLEQTTSQTSVIDQTLSQPGVHSFRISYRDAFKQMFAHFSDRPLKYLYFDSVIPSSEQKSRRLAMQAAAETGHSGNEIRIVKVDQEGDIEDTIGDAADALKDYEADVILGYINRSWMPQVTKMAQPACHIYPFTLEADIPGFFVDPEIWMQAILPQIYANFEDRQAKGEVHNFFAQFKPN